MQQAINQFSHVVVDDKTLQQHTAQYIMLHKPAGVVSATADNLHTTVIDLLNKDNGQTIKHIHNLHIAGRLDRQSTGLLLLTNDGAWSRGLSSPENEIAKRYRVTVKNPITEDYIDAFAAGMEFSYEGIITKPVTLKIVSPCVAEVILTEGKYHQIKRMFGRFRNPVLALHRYAIGDITLDAQLAPGHYRILTEDEIGFLSS